jgi:hypothetical protein
VTITEATFTAASDASRSSHSSMSFTPTLPSDPRPVRSGVPVSIPSDEVYYWTVRWQTDEAESFQELRDGHGVTFSTATDAIRWLLDPTDDC